MKDEFTIIDCPSCNGGGKTIEILCTSSLFGGYNEQEMRSDKDCKRCNGLGKLKIRVDEIVEEKK